MGKVVLDLKEEVNKIIKEELKIIQKENNMSREEYAEMHYLLAKLKYMLADMSLNIPSVRTKNLELIDKIDDICKICIIDNEKGKDIIIKKD